MEKLASQIQFILEIDKLKSVIRRSYLLNGQRLENSAEHSWHLAMMALILTEYANETVDPLRVIKLLLIHDIVEIDAGDTYLYDEAGTQTKANREQAAATRIFGLLPPAQATELHTLWQEYEARQTAESKFANVLDRLMPLLHNFHTNGIAWQAHNIRRDMVLNKVKHMAEGSDTLWAFAQEVIDTAVSRGYLAA